MKPANFIRVSLSTTTANRGEPVISLAPIIAIVLALLAVATVLYMPLGAAIEPPLVMVSPQAYPAAQRALQAFAASQANLRPSERGNPPLPLQLQVASGEEAAQAAVAAGRAQAYICVDDHIDYVHDYIDDEVPSGWTGVAAIRTPNQGLTATELLVDPVLIFARFPSPLAGLDSAMARQVADSLVSTGSSPLPGLWLGSLEDRRPDWQPLSVGGVFPGAATAADGSYGLGRPVRLLFDPDRSLPQAIRDFRRFLQSPQGRAAWLGLKPEIRLAAVGDVMLDRGVATAMTTFGLHHPVSALAARLAAYDLTVANLESPFGTTGKPVPGKGIWFQADPSTAALLKRAGIDAVSLANNHTLDFGEEAFLENLQILEREGIAYFGGGRNLAEARRPLILTAFPSWLQSPEQPPGQSSGQSPWQSSGQSYGTPKDSRPLRIAFLAYSELADVYWSSATRWSFAAATTRPGVAPLRPGSFASIAADIRSARTRADLVIVYYHWGQEYKPQPTARQQEIGRRTLAAGADLVLGAHPHVLQGIGTGSELESGLIAYSLGNFIMDQPWPATRESMILEVDLDATGVRGFRAVPVEIDNGRPELVEGETSVRRDALFALLSAAATRVGF